MKKITTLIFTALIVCGLSGCTKNSHNSNASIILQAEGSFSTDDVSKATKQVIDDNTTVLDIMAADLNFDGEEELLVLSTWGRNEIHVFRKNGDTINKASTFGTGKLDYITELNLSPCLYKNEKLYCFEFHYDNGGVMTADVVGSIKVDNKNEYKVEYLLSKGKLTYSDIAEPTEKDFYRIGWSPTDVALGGKYNEITVEEYWELYNELKLSR